VARQPDAPDNPPTCFTYSPWWTEAREPSSICLQGYDAGDKIAYVIHSQKTFWEVDQLEYIAMVGPAGGIYVDVGSNIGNHAVFFGRFCADHVVAVEPHPRLQPILAHNLESNDLASRSTVVHAGISDTGTAGAMSLRDEHERNIGASHIVPGAEASADDALVRLRRLDDLLDELRPLLPALPFTFLKIDVEGMEMSVLRSATRLLRDHRPQILVELITEDALNEASTLLNEFGYQWVARLGSPPAYHFIVPGRHQLRENKWHGGNYYAHAMHLTEQEVASVTPADAILIVADLDEAGFGSTIAGHVRLPFIEKQGSYFGPPTNDEHAIEELARLRARGATHFVLLWPAFWFADAYPRFEQHLRQVHRCVFESERTIVFDLRNST
jgi:FkbM family methyltransferase